MQIRTEILIDAPAQTIWSILDDLAAYGAWNRVMPKVGGKTLVGQRLDVTLALDGLPEQQIQPEILRIIPLREIRWLTADPTPGVFSAEHWLELVPQENGQTLFRNDEDFGGSALAEMWPVIEPAATASYHQMNRDLKARAEALARAPVSLHPALDRVSANAKVAELTCSCAADPVRAAISGQLYHTHLCGCTQCWRPEGALFSVVSLAGGNDVHVTAGAEHLRPVDPDARLTRFACARCGTHLYAETQDPTHHFYGTKLVHPDLASGPIPVVEFAGFTASLIGGGLAPHAMNAVNHALHLRGVTAYDAFSPAIMDVLAWHDRKIAPSP